MSNFKVGQKVVCVIKIPNYDLSNTFYDGLKMPIKDEIYTIRDIDVSGNEQYLLLNEIVNSPMITKQGICEIMFKYDWFAPLNHAFADEVESMIKEQLKEEHV